MVALGILTLIAYGIDLMFGLEPPLSSLGAILLMLID